MAEVNGSRTLGSAASAATPGGALKGAGQQLAGMLVQRAALAATERVEGLSDKLTGVAENGGELRRRPRNGGRGSRDEDAEDRDDERDDDSDDDSGGLFGGLGDKIKGLFGKSGGGSGGQGKKLKVTNIVEQLDVGLPLRTTYDLWTQFADFPSFMKKVESVEQASDEKTNWKAKVLLSHRTWEATIVEQVPDQHIVWRSKGAKGHVDGAVAFTPLGPNMTRVLLVLEYYPQGLFERTGNIWRAQGRRARLEFKHFRRHAMTNVLLHREEVEGWRGTIHDSEVVQTHEEALEAERAEESTDQQAGGETRDDRAVAEGEGEADEGLDEEREDLDDEDIADDEADEADDYLYDDEDDLEDEEPYADEDAYEDDDEDRDDTEDRAHDDEPDEDVPEERPRRRRQPVGARSRRGG
jgi:hypothetical protein